MIRKTLSGMLLLIPALAAAQAEEGYHEHDGFFLSMNVGPAFGPIVLDASGAPYNELDFSGLGGMLDLKIGGTIAKTVTLSFDVLSRAISGPKVEVDGNEGSSSDNVSAGDVLYGLGATYYFMPANVFVSATVGTAVFTLRDKSAGLSASSEAGFGMNLKAGKEWWVGRNWGLGVSAGYGFARADDKDDPDNPGYSGKMSTNKFFIMFNTTYN